MRGGGRTADVRSLAKGTTDGVVPPPAGWKKQGRGFRRSGLRRNAQPSRSITVTRNGLSLATIRRMPKWGAFATFGLFMLGTGMRAYWLWSGRARTRSKWEQSTSFRVGEAADRAMVPACSTFSLVLVAGICGSIGGMGVSHIVQVVAQLMIVPCGVFVWTTAYHNWPSQLIAPPMRG